MENFRKIALGFTVFFAIIAGIRVYMIHRERVEATLPAAAPVIDYHLTDDDLVSPRKIFPATMKDAKALVGTTVWVSAGGQIDFYPYTGHTIDFAHKAGTLLGADELHVKDFTLAVTPKSVFSRFRAGDKQVFVVFTRNEDTAKLFAAPVGYEDASGYTFYLDTIFFYDDVHGLYKHWPQPVWDAIMRHEAIAGMSERQAQLALGQVESSESNDVGNRTVQYFNLGKQVNVTFEHNKATSIVPAPN